MSPLPHFQAQLLQLGHQLYLFAGIGKKPQDGPQGGDIQGLSADLLEAARRRNLSANSLAAYERTWTRFLAWAAALNFDPRHLPFPEALEAYRFLGDGKNAASLKQIRAALSFAYKHWDLKNPFAKIEPPLHKGAPDPLLAPLRDPSAPRLS
jgi:hypothetical protein